jgi:Arc/MetJ-type ribon-helix-helix transcriptional regulator
MSDNRSNYTRRLTVHITEPMDDRLEQVARQRDEPKSEVVRAALRAWLDEQEDLIGSRKHFTKMFGRRVDALERLVVITLGMSLETLHMFYERVNKKTYDPGDLLEDMIRSGLAAQDSIQTLIEHVAQAKTKPPA